MNQAFYLRCLICLNEEFVLPSLLVLTPGAGSGVDAAEVVHRTQGIETLGSLPLVGRYGLL